MDSLKDIYEEAYGSLEQEAIESGETIEKLADALQTSPEEIAQALFEEGYIDEEGNWLGEEEGEDVEKTAEDFDAAGRIMARGLLSELEEIEKESAAGIGGLKSLGEIAPTKLRRLMARLRQAKGVAGKAAKKPYVKYPGVAAGAGVPAYLAGKKRGGNQR